MSDGDFWDRFERRAESFSRRVARVTPAGTPTFLLLVVIAAPIGFPGGFFVWLPLLVALAIVTHVISRHVSNARFHHWFSRLGDGARACVGGDIYVKRLGYWSNGDTALTDDEMLALSESSTEASSFHSPPPLGIARMAR